MPAEPMARLDHSTIAKRDILENWHRSLHKIDRHRQPYIRERQSRILPAESPVATRLCVPP